MATQTYYDFDMYNRYVPLTVDVGGVDQYVDEPGAATLSPYEQWQQSSLARTMSLEAARSAPATGSGLVSLANTMRRGNRTGAGTGGQNSVLWPYTQQDAGLLEGFSLANLVQKPVMATVGAPNLPTYAAPARSKTRQKFLTAQAGAVPRNKLGKALERAMVGSGSISEPALRNDAVRKALAGAGEGFADIATAAGREGRALYEHEYGGEVDAAKTQHTTAMQAAIMDYHGRRDAAQAQYQADLARYQTVMNALMSLSALMRNPVTNAVGVYPLADSRQIPAAAGSANVGMGTAGYRLPLQYFM